MRKMTKAERYQQGFRAYQNAVGGKLAAPKDAIEWMVANYYIGLPKIDPVQIAAAELSQALREETSIDADGTEYRVNYAVNKSGDDGGQQTLWGTEEFAPILHKEMSLMQRREGVLNDLVKLYNDVKHHNRANPGRPFNLVLNFDEDVPERILTRQMSKAA